MTITHDALDISHAAADSAVCAICNERNATAPITSDPSTWPPKHPDEIADLMGRGRVEPRNPAIARSLKTDTLRLAFAIGWLQGRAATDSNIAELLAYIDQPEEGTP